MSAVAEAGRKIRQLRIAGLGRRLTQEEIAVKAGISVSFLSLIERGERAPGLDTLAAIAAALDVPLAELFRYDSDPDVIDPLHRPIVDFCRDRPMTRRDVERAVAILTAAIG